MDCVVSIEDCLKSAACTTLHAAITRTEGTLKFPIVVKRTWKDYEGGLFAQAEGFWGRRGTIVLPTGAGKTRVAAAAMAKTGLATLCLVPTRVLLEQWHKQLSAHYSSEIGIYGDGTRRLAPITIATFESAYRNIGMFGNKFGLLVIDEAHHFATGARAEILELCTARARLALTATLNTESGFASPLTTLVGPVVYELGITDLAGTFLANFDAYSLHVELTPDERVRYEADIGLYRKHLSAFRRSCPEASWADFARHATRTPEGRNALAALRSARKLIAFPVPAYLDRRDHPWLTSLLEVYSSYAGKPRRLLNARLLEDLPMPSPPGKRSLPSMFSIDLREARHLGNHRPESCARLCLPRPLERVFYRMVFRAKKLLPLLRGNSVFPC